MFRSRLAILALVLSPLASIAPAQAHGSHGGGGETLEAGEFDFTPIITIEGHGGYDNNLVDHPKHYAIDGMFGGVFEWGLGEGASFAIEAAFGPSLVFGEAEHFYGSVHVEEHGAEEGHGHEEEHEHGHDTGHEYGHEHEHKHGHGHGHGHDRGHEREREHDHAHEHEHKHGHQHEHACGREYEHVHKQEHEHGGQHWPQP